MGMGPLPAIVLCGFVAGCGGTQPNAPVFELAATGDTLVTSYSELTEGAWLGGNRWAVLAPQDNAVGLADFGTKRVAELGGQDSRELRNPSSLFTSGDTLYVGDWGLRRLTLWTRSGRLVRAVPASDRLRGALPRGRDASARFYIDLFPSPGPDGSGNRDSAAVIQTDPALTGSVADTIARLAPMDIAEVHGDAGRRFERRVFSGVDRWGVVPEGSLWVARVYDNRVDWRAPDGRWNRGQALPDRVLEVTRYDRELFLRKFPPELRRTAQDLPFAALKPPFESAVTSPAGEVWLEKSRAPADSARRYHIVDRQGRLVREIRVRGHGRILAVGARSALVAEPFARGIRLIRIEIPPQPESPRTHGEGE
jgi:hypothetical protein